MTAFRRGDHPGLKGEPWSCAEPSCPVLSLLLPASKKAPWLLPVWDTWCFLCFLSSGLASDSTCDRCRPLPLNRVGCWLQQLSLLPLPL